MLKKMQIKVKHILHRIERGEREGTLPNGTKFTVIERQKGGPTRFTMRLPEEEAEKWIMKGTLKKMDLAIKQIQKGEPGLPVQEVRPGDLVMVYWFMPEKKGEISWSLPVTGIVTKVNSESLTIAQRMRFKRYEDGREVPDKIGDASVISIKHIRYIKRLRSTDGKLFPSASFVKQGQQLIDEYWNELQSTAGVRTQLQIQWVPGEALYDDEGNIVDDIQRGNVIKVNLLNIDVVFDLMRSHLIWEVITKEKGQQKLIDIANAQRKLQDKWIYEDREDAVKAFNRLSEARMEMERLQRDLLKKIKEEKQDG